MANSIKKDDDFKRKIEDEQDEQEEEEEEEKEEKDETKNIIKNKFANDGSFFETFKKMQQEKKLKQQDNCQTEYHKEKLKENELIISKKKPKALKCGVIQKKRKDESLIGQDESSDSNGGSNSAWNRYMNEVRAYKQKYGDDEQKNRPLVK